MTSPRAQRIAVAGLIALFVGVVGGWALSRSSDDVDAKLTSPGVVQDPTIGTNGDIRGEAFRFTEMTELGTSTGKAVPQLAGRPAVVNFWFSTCEPCRREMPALAAAAGQWTGVVDFIGINPNDTVDSATAFLSKLDVSYPNWLDQSGEQLALAEVGTMPTTFFLSADGTVVSMHAGELSAEDLASGLAGLGVSR